MPQTVPIEIFRIGKMQVDRDEVRRWLDFIGAEAFVIPDDEEITNNALLVALAGKRCYKSFVEGLNPNVTRIRKEYAAYFDNILASGHGSVLEHCVYQFAIENVSRVFTGEMNRHRAGWAISEGSMRFIRYSKSIPYWEPDSIKGPDIPRVPAEYRNGPESEIPTFYLTECYNGAVMEFHEMMTAAFDTEEPDDDFPALIRQEVNRIASAENMNPIDIKKHLSRSLLKIAFRHQEESYRRLETIWADELAPDSKFHGKKEITSMMRRIVGMGVATGGVWTGNIRALRHVITMRASPQAEEEMLHVFSRIAKRMRDEEPLLFGDFEETPEGFWKPKYVKV